jgi:hypothetical protein
MALTTGVLGGFTTYSTFSYESVRLLQEKAWLLAFANIGATTVTCLLASFLGILVGRLIVSGSLFARSPEMERSCRHRPTLASRAGPNVPSPGVCIRETSKYQSEKSERDRRDCAGPPHV